MSMKPLAAATLLLAGTALPALADDVSTERLLNANAEADNWLMVHRTYDSHRFSPLDRINRDTVANLHVVFTQAIGGLPGAGRNTEGGHQATPLVDGGIMYFADGWGTVYRVDVRAGNRGTIDWTMDPGIDKANVWINSNRGLALYKDQVVSMSGDGQVFWTNATTGELLRSVQVEDTATGYAITAAPLVIGDKVIIGGSGGDRGARDHIDALNADTGDKLWRTYTIPAPGEAGSETWKDDNNAWQHGGGAFWVTGAYDPETNLTIWGTGNPVPMFDPEYRPGDNLFTNSTVAYDVDSGAMRWYFQYTPGDFLDFDEVGVNLLVDADVDGEARKLLGHFGRNGFFYTLDRTNGQFVNAAQYVANLNWTAGIDPKTGKPVEYDASKDIQTYAIGAPSRRDQGEVEACPNIQGGVNMFPTAYSDATHLAYGAGIEGCSNVSADASKSDGQNGWNGGAAGNADRQTGSITAMNPATGERTAQHLLDYPSYSGVLATAGGLVFTSTVEGTVLALDDTTLEPLWSFATGSFSAAPPMTYGVDGKQYVAILIGARGTPRGLLNKSPEVGELQNTSMLYVFGL